MNPDAHQVSIFEKKDSNPRECPLKQFFTLTNILLQVGRGTRGVVRMDVAGGWDMFFNKFFSASVNIYFNF